jgi:tetratricopeptide (TPR) repeat protein
MRRVEPEATMAKLFQWTQTVEIIRGTVILLMALGGLGWLMARSLKRSDEPPRLIIKWIVTALVIAFLYWKVGPLADSGGGDAWVAVIFTLVCGLILAATWRHSIGEMIARPFEVLYNGGDLAPEPRPVYSVARTRQKQGKYLEAIAEIRRQLERFPTDLEGLMLLAQIQAEDLKDLPGAEIAVERLCAQKHAPQNIAYALHSMADWHMKIGQDREAARRDLEKITELLPDTEFALGAAQRIAHLGSTDMLIAGHEPKKYVVKEGPKNLGLIQGRSAPKPAETDFAQVAADYVKHLEQHPLDTEAREKLAVLYVDHYHRLDLASDQLEQMIAQPAQPVRFVAHWLNLLADLQIRSGSDYDTVAQTLQRVIDLDSSAPAADVARNRLSKVRLELKIKQQNEPVKLGTYEQNIGLKARRGAG